MRTAVMLLLTLCFICNDVSYTRRHSKKPKVFGDFTTYGFRKNIISKLPKEKTKFLDIILNRAVTELMNSISNSEKRKQIASSNEKIFDFNELPLKLRKDLQSSIRTARKTWKNSNPLFDPFDGGNDPYTDATSNTSDSPRQNNLENNKPSLEDDGSRDGSRELMQNKEIVSVKANKKEELHEKYSKSSEKSSYFKKNNDKIDDDRVSEILPVDGGSIMLLKNGRDNDEIKLDVPNVQFDVKLNSSNDRDNMVRNLKTALRFINALKFKEDGETDDSQYISKNESLIIGQKRGGAEKDVDGKKLPNGSVNSSLPEIKSRDPSSDLKKLLPQKASYFIDHDGDLYRVEKVHLVTDAQSDIPHSNSSDIVEKPTVHQNEKNEELKQIEIMNGINPTQNSDYSQRTSNLQKSDKELENPINADSEENSFIIKHGVQIYKVVQTNENRASGRLENQASERFEKKENDFQKNADNTSLNDRKNFDNQVNPREDNQVNPRESEENIVKETPGSKTDENTYEIKHNNKIFRITEIKNKSMTSSPNTRSLASIPRDETSGSFNTEPTTTNQVSDNTKSNTNSGKKEILSTTANENGAIQSRDEYVSQVSDVSNSSNTSDDEDVTYVFTTASKPTYDNRESFNNTLYEDVTP